jgi:hypothetical protein
MKKLRTEIIINATPATIWKVLTDFALYPKWNPFVHISGRPEVGTKLENTMYIEGQKPQVFRPEVLVVDPQKEFRWEGHLFVKGLFDGEHYFQLEPMAGGKTRFVHGEHFRGILVGLILKMIGEQTLAGFEKMNTALKQRCEEMENGSIS